MGTLVEKFQNEDIALFEAIKEFQQGNEEKATYIYENTKKYTYRMIYQNVSRFKSQSVLTGDEGSIAEDVMQELYLDFFKNISKFRNEDPKSFYKWISIVSNRMVLKYVDKNKMEVLQCGENEDFREDKDIWDATEMSDDDLEQNLETLPEAALEDKEFQKLIMDFVQSLPEVQAQTVIYHFYSGMKYQEIADEMSVSLITVKTRMKKAQDSLKEIVTKYEKKTGTKLHSVSVLPMLWLLYRMSSESTTVPVAVDAAVTSSITGASGMGIGSATTAGTTAVTKAISTRVLIAIVSTTVAIGGITVGSLVIGRKQEPTIEQGDLGHGDASDNKQGNKSENDLIVDKDTLNTNDEPIGSETNNQTQGENNGSDINNTTSNNSVTQNNAEVGTNTNGTGGNTGTGNASGNQDSGNSSVNEGTSSGSGDDGKNFANQDTTESTATKGTKENPYRIGEKIIVTDDIVYNGSQNNGYIYHLEITVTGYTPISEYYASGHTYSSFSNLVKAKIKLLGDDTEPREKTPIMLGAELTDGRRFSWSGTIQSQAGQYIDEIYMNVEYDIGLNHSADYFTEDSVIAYYTIGYFKADGTFNTLYVKIE